MKKNSTSLPKKIIFFSRDLKIGGMEKALVSLLNELVKRNHRVTLVLEKKEGVLIDQLSKDILVKEYVSSSFSFVPLRKAINLLHRFFWGICHYRKYDFSCNYATYSVIGSKLALLASSNSSLYVHSNYPALYRDDRAQVEAFFDSVFMKKFQHVIFVSNESLESTERIFPDLSKRFKVINNIVDYRGIRRKAEEKHDVLDPSVTNFLFVGRLDDSSKNFDLLIDSFKKAFSLSDTIRLILVGDGLDRKKIESRIINEKITCIELLGEKENPYPFIRECDCLILTSRYEGYPVIYTEALVLNKQFITTVPVSDDFVDVRDYFTICSHDHCEISDSILSIQKKKTDYKIDFEQANVCRISQFEKLF